MSDETWKPIPSADGYEASSHGRVRCLLPWLPWKPPPPRVLKARLDRDGYLGVSVVANGGRRSRKVAHLVAEAFHGPRPDGMLVCHNNGIRNDNRPENLRYDTQKGNLADRHSHGTAPQGERGNRAILTEADVLMIRAGDRPLRALANDLGVSLSTIKAARYRRNWSHLP